MNLPITAIFFDVGGTLRANDELRGSDFTAVERLMALIGESGRVEDFTERLRQREKQYRRWCKRTLVELSEAELWAQYMLPEFPGDFVRENAVRFNQMWRETRQPKTFTDMADTIKALKERGYTLAIISNTTSSTEAPRLLAENGISDLFATVILSTTFGRRKPHPSLFLAAAREIGVSPTACAYVGDNPARDLVGARQAGYGDVVLIRAAGVQPGEADADDEVDENEISYLRPDAVINRLSELLDRYPVLALNGNLPVKTEYQQECRYDAALSTMWGIDQAVPFQQTFELGQQVGFPRFELNHKISPERFKQWNARRFYIATVHDPCPAVYNADEQRANDFYISSLNENCRTRGVDLVKSTIELACQLGSRSVVLHPGQIQCDTAPEKRLCQLYDRGLKGTPEYEVLKAEIIAEHARRAPAHIEQVVKSLEELIAFTRGMGVDLGLENRYHYYHIPTLDEMGTLLGLCDEVWYGFQYDCGHAQAMEALGFFEHEEWLKRYSQRIVGVHLHDVIGYKDHQMPGSGEVDFKKIAAYLPASAQRTLEVSPKLTVDELQHGMDTLVEAGCISRL